MSHAKIQVTHQQRQAVIYVRQSSLHQVEQNRESQRRQYQLVERAQTLGWPAARCLVIDDDLGVSAAHSANRPGYQRLVSMVALREVGLVLGLEVLPPITFFRHSNECRNPVCFLGSRGRR